MDSFDPVEHAEAAERISINGEEAIVYHARNPTLDQQEFANIIHEASMDHEFEEPHRLSKPLLEDASDILCEVHKLAQNDFAMEFYEHDELSSEMSMAISGAFSYCPVDPDYWNNSQYPQNDPTTADVIAAFVSLVNASWCVNHLENTLESQEGLEAGQIFTDNYFNVQVTKGLMTAFRDAFVTNAPRSAIQGMYFREPTYGIVDAINNTLGLELTDVHLHGLMLTDWNQSVNLQAASQYGKEKSVTEGMNALENIVNAVTSED